MAVVRAKESFVTYVDGVRVAVPEGAIFDSSDPVVKGRESLFSTPEAAVRTPEAATAAPGEKRAVKRLAKGV